MAKKTLIVHNINKSSDLVTPREQTRAGFISLALEKNYLAVPYIEEAKTLKSLADKVKTPIKLIDLLEIRAGLLTASGLSEKSLNYLNEDDKIIAIKGLIKEFLEPAGNQFVDELVYRYLLTKGDALGGRARNLAGTLGERKFLRTLISVLNISGKKYFWKDSEGNKWHEKTENDIDIEKRLKGLYWKNDKNDRLLMMNITVPMVKKNVDLCILNGNIEGCTNGKDSIIYNFKSYIALGELKGGIDPAGADEHWKTAGSALERIRNSYLKLKFFPQTFFVGAAIENSMAEEIFKHLKNGTLSNAANLTNDNQLISVCKWITEL